MKLLNSWRSFPRRRGAGRRKGAVVAAIVALAAGACVRTRYVEVPGPAPERIRIDSARLVRTDTVVITRVVTEPPRPEVPLWAEVSVFYATDRKRVADDSARTGVFGVDRTAGPLSLGKVSVSIPLSHRPGHIDSPAWYAVWERPDPTKFMAITKLQEIGDQSEALDTLRAMVSRSMGRQAFVFVHGYNVGFDEAALRTAQLARDFGFDGVPILYSWPSKNAFYRYTNDANEVDESSRNLARFLDQVQRVTGAKRVHVIAHSMGAQIALKALAVLRPTLPDTVFGQIVLAAPDMKVGLFRALLPDALGIARRVTLYASDKDDALLASHVFWSGQRAGELRPQIVRSNRLDSVDASRTSTDLLGHGYYAANRAMIDDVMNLLDGVGPGELRRHLSPKGQPPSAWWFIP